MLPISIGQCVLVVLVIVDNLPALSKNASMQAANRRICVDKSRMLEQKLKENMIELGQRPHRALQEALKSLELVIDVEDLDDIPDATCIGRHLPPDREPTRDEIQAAIAKCKKQK
jgi:hypothetical protein